MNDLSTLLHDIAGDAKYYDATDAAITVARRQRRLVRLVPVAAAVVAVAVLVAGVYLRPAPTGPPIDNTPFTAPTSAVSWLPNQVTGRTGQPALPTDRGVGVASFIYTLPATSTVSDGVHPIVYPTVLVTTAGTQYRLPDSAFQSGLSPDGRWLLLVGNGGPAVLRDLTSTRQVDLGIELGGGLLTAFWADDSSRLATMASSDGRVTVVDLPSGHHHAVSISRYADTGLCGIQDAGDLILCPMSMGQPRVTVRTVDNTSGQQRRAVTIDLSGTLTASERQEVALVGLALFNPLPGGHQLLFQTLDYDAAHGVATAGDLLVLDLDGGTVVRRLSLPRNTPPITEPDNGGVRFIYPNILDVLATGADGILMVHLSESVADPDAVVRDLQLVNPTTGARTIVTTVSGNIETLKVRGSTL